MLNDLQLAEAIREAYLSTALAAYEDAAISGLCCEGRWEIAAQTIRTRDIQSMLDQSNEKTVL